jgi:two-component system, cell cycle sensor histidine kinase and response regulator CckA
MMMVPMANEPRPPVVILAIDDDINVLDGVKRLLEDENCEVVTASDPLEGIRLYAERWREIKLVLLDFSMPTLRGDEVFKRLRQINSGARVLLMSGFDVETPLPKMLQDGLWGFVEKPFLPGELVDRVRAAISSP